MPLRFHLPRYAPATAIFAAAFCLALGSASGIARAALPLEDGAWPLFGDTSTQVPYDSDGIIVDLEAQGSGYVALVAGAATSNAGIRLVRYNSQHTLDLGFGTQGKAGIAGNHLVPRQIAIDSSERIVVVGHNSDTGYAFVARFTATGALDTSFSSSGLVELNHCDSDTLTSVVIRNNGNIYAAGVSEPGGAGCPAQASVLIYGLTQSGTPISDLGTSGRVTYPVAGIATDNVGAISVTPNDQLLVGGAGRAASDNEFDAFVLQFEFDGTIDTSFAGQGVVVLDSALQVHDLLMDSSGIFTAAVGTAADGTVLYRFSSSGELDTSFGIDGVSEGSDVGSAMVAAATNYKAAVQHSDGRISTCDYVSRNGIGTVRIARFDTDGVLENSRNEANQTADQRIIAGCISLRDDVFMLYGAHKQSGVLKPVLEAEYVRSDFIPPFITVSQIPMGEQVQYVIAATDLESGIEDAEGAYSIDGVNWHDENTFLLPNLAPGDPDRVISVRDRAGNVAVFTIVAPPITDPKLSVEVSSASQYDSITFTGSVTEAADITEPLEYSFDGGATWQESPVATHTGLLPSMNRTVSFVARDANGVSSNPATHTAQTLDNGKPRIILSDPRSPRSLRSSRKRPLIMRNGRIKVTITTGWGGVSAKYAYFRGGRVKISDSGVIDVRSLRQGSGPLVVRASDIDGETGLGVVHLLVDRTAPSARTTTKYVLGNQAVMTVHDRHSGPAKRRVRGKISSVIGPAIVRATVADKAGNKRVAAARLERRLALRDQSLNADIKLKARNGSTFTSDINRVRGAFRFIAKVAPWYAQEATQDPYVREAQWRLVKMKCLKPGGFANGWLDAPTIDAVQRYQEAVDLPRLGTIGPRTRKQLDHDLRRQLPARCADN